MPLPTWGCPTYSILIFGSIPPWRNQCVSHCKSTPLRSTPSKSLHQPKCRMLTPSSSAQLNPLRSRVCHKPSWAPTLTFVVVLAARSGLLTSQPSSPPLSFSASISRYWAPTPLFRWTPSWPVSQPFDMPGRYPRESRLWPYEDRLYPREDRLPLAIVASSSQHPNWTSCLGFCLKTNCNLIRPFGFNTSLPYF